MGRATADVLRAMGLSVHIVTEEDKLVKTIDAVLYAAYSSDQQGCSAIATAGWQKGMVMLQRREVVSKINQVAAMR